MKLTFLGTGTSTGVPQIQCHCPVCTSPDPRDTRLRASALVDTGSVRLLLDCGPDFRTQMLRVGAPDLDALLITHSHYDHVGGLDDLRPYCYALGGFPVYCKEDVADDLRQRVPYCFTGHNIPGIPSFKIRVIDPHQPFTVNGQEVIPLPVMHFRLPILGYRIGNLAYITDCKIIPDSTMQLLEGVDTLVINALRHTEHPSHMSLEQSLDVIRRVAPRRAYLTHLAHQIGLHAEQEPMLPDGVYIAFDGLVITTP